MGYVQIVYSMADVVNSKRHQRLDEILIRFTRTIQEISKVVCKKTMSETRAFITSLCSRNARITASVCCADRIALSFAGVLHDRVVVVVFFLKTTLLISPMKCRGKKKKKKKSRFCWWRFQLATSPKFNIIYFSIKTTNTLKIPRCIIADALESLKMLYPFSV